MEGFDVSWKITSKIAGELIQHEGLVREAYKDSVGVWTWSIGVTSSSGHKVYPRYKDNPQTVKRCFEVYEWLLRTKYLPDVQEAFDGRTLTESQLGSALSFHYNTGGIKRASWVKLWLQGDIAGARKAFMNWRKPPEIIPRREKERDLFFDGTWTLTWKATEYQVNKPSYTPNWASATQIEIKDVLEDLFGAG